MKRRQEDLKKQGERILAYQQSYNKQQQQQHDRRPPQQQPSHPPYHPYAVQSSGWGANAGSGSLAATSAPAAADAAGVTAAGAATAAAAAAGPKSGLQAMSYDDRKKYYDGYREWYGGPGYGPYFYPMPAGFSTMMYRKLFVCLVCEGLRQLL